MKTSVKDKIEYLESLGYEVDIIHHRRLIERTHPGRLDDKTRLSSKGGYTFVEARRSDGVIREKAECSDEDNYNRKIGANIALGRAIKTANYWEKCANE